MTLEDYSIELHVHRLAAWAASTAARSGKTKFPVKLGVQIIEDSGLRAYLTGPDSLPSSRAMDHEHEKWCRRVIASARKHHLRFRYGVAAKLVNCYFKVAFVTLHHSAHARVARLHPPVDRSLLAQLAREQVGDVEFWRKMKNVGWSNFNRKQYMDVIQEIRQTVQRRPLWTIERYWPGHR